MYSRSLFAAVALTLGFLLQAPAEDPTATAPDELATCATCGGKTRLELECTPCDGSGEAGCTGCSKPAPYHTLSLAAALAGHLGLEHFEELERATTPVEGHVFPYAFLAPRGHLACPASCINGMVLAGQVIGRKCMHCEGRGYHACPRCEGKGRSLCWSCTGKSRVSAPCPECLGRGESRPLARREVLPLTACPWCEGRVVRSCTGCPEGGSEPRACEACAGTRKAPCSTCAGTGHDSCHTCRSTGVGERGKNCSGCRGKGSSRCGSCRRGFTDCGTCEGKGQAPAPCRACRGLPFTPCSGCTHGVGLAWAVTGERLVAADARELGVAHLEHALAREQARLDAELGKARLTADERQRRAAELTRRRITPLRRKVEAAKRR